MKHAAKAILVQRKHVRHRPWMSDAILALIDQRSQARIIRDYELEQQLIKQIKN